MRKIKKIKKEIKNHPCVYLVLGIILVLALFFRVYRVNDLLGFYYDQGRDALKVLDILAFKDWPAIGPTTGIEGLFLGPFWFYLLAPFYWLGQGNPVWPAVMMGFLDTITVFLLYYFGKEFLNRKIGLLAAFFWGFSYYLVRLIRWFSNPSALPFFTLLLLIGLVMFFLKKRPNYLLLVSLSLAVSFQLEIASAVFFLPVIGVCWLFFRPSKINKKILLFSFLLFFLFLIPQILFEVKNGFLMTRNFFSFSKGELNTDNATWAWPTLSFLKQRLGDYYQIFFSKLNTNVRWPSLLVLGGFLAYLGFMFKKKLGLKRRKKAEDKDLVFLLLMIFLFLPLFLLFFFAGNYGRLYDYYLTGYFPAFVILMAAFTAFFFQKKFFWPLGVLILVWFLAGNWPFLKNYLQAGTDGPTHVSLGNQIQAIDWLYQDAGGEPFNVDVYVPPVIPLAYDYLVPWWGQKQDYDLPVADLRPLLYTLAEVDPAHPERLSAWQERQAGLGEVEKTATFGGITAQRRKRLN